MVNLMSSTKSNEKPLRVKFSNVNWDVDEEDFFSDEDIILPTEFTTYIQPPEDEDIELSEYLSDWLSDEYGYCHNGFNFEIINGDDDD